MYSGSYELLFMWVVYRYKELKLHIPHIPVTTRAMTSAHAMQSLENSTLTHERMRVKKAEYFGSIMKITLISQAREGPVDPRGHWTTL